MIGRHPPWLFDPIARVDQRLPGPTEPSFNYLNESARAEAGMVRLGYWDWLSRYPAPARSQLVRSFRSKKDRAHRAAAFELVLHELLVQLGGAITVPPDVNGQTRPDFDVRISDERAVVEASLVTDEDEFELQREKCKDVLLEEWNRRPHPRFGVHLWECLVNPRRQPPASRLRDALGTMLNAASDDDVAQWAGMVAARDFARLPKWIHDRDGSRLVVSPVPAVPMLPFRKFVVPLTPVTELQTITIGEAILRKIEGKAQKHYDVGGRPLVLALAVTHWAGSDDFGVFRALFGTERWPIIKRDGQHGLGESFRDRDGVWPPRSRNRRSSVSAIIVFRRFDVWAPWATNWRVYVNPWARTPAPSWLLRLPSWAEREDGEFRYSEGISVAELLAAHVPERTADGWPWHVP